MKIKIPLIVMIVSVLAVIGMRIYHLTNAIEYTTGLNKSGYFTNYALPIFLIISMIAMFVLSLLSEDSPVDFPGRASISCGILALVCGALIGVDSVMQIFNPERRMFEGTPGLVYAAMGVTVVMTFLFIAFSCFNGINNILFTPLIMLFPILWTGLRMVLTFLEFGKVANISENTYDIVMLAFRLLFFVFFSKYLSGIADSSSKWMFATGTIAALTSIAASLPRVVLSRIISSDNTGAYEMTVRTDTAFKPNYVDLAFGIFLFFMLFYLATKRYVEVFAGSRQGGYAPAPVYRQQPVPQQQYAAAPVPARQQAAAPAAKGQKRQQQPAAQRAPMPNPAQRMPMMGGQMGMYGYPYNMYGYNPYAMQGMPGYGMPGMQAMQGMPGAPGMPPMAAQAAAQYGAAAAAAQQQAQAAAQASAAMQQTLLKGGGADNFTQKGAGLRVANQFHVKGGFNGQSGSSHTRHGSRFSGLDDFRSNLLTGRQALEAIDDVDEEEIEESAAENLESQNAEMESGMLNDIENALANAQGEFSNASQPPLEESMDVSDDDGAMPEPPPRPAKAEPRAERPAGAAPGKKKGRLADRLEEERKRRAEAAYANEYDQPDEDEYDDEYDDEDEEYDELEYGSGEYDYEYSNGYVPRAGSDNGYYDDDDDEYDDEYDDDEYDDDEYDDDEYDDDYDDDDYDDDDYDDDYDDDEDEYYDDEG